MSRVPEHTIDRIRESVDIIHVISGYLSLKKQGKNYTALCPFHTEKTPSFKVNPDKQIFHCFGCGAGGNVFSFLMKYEKISFLEAVEKLAAEAGIDLPKYRQDKREDSQYERLYRANQFAADFYARTLDEHGPTVVNYLAQRGITHDTVKFFKIGFAPDRWDTLRKAVQYKKENIDNFLNSGLILRSEKDSSRLYDRFRNPLMFPIHNLSGRIVAFGGRTLSEEIKGPKYINSPESQIYFKSQILYGLYFSKDWIRQEEYAIIVEGYMDYLQLFQSQVKNIVATSGTAITEDHSKILHRYTQKVVLCYDADTAGINAALRGGQILFQDNLDVRVLILPEGEDPDSFLRKNSASAFYSLANAAPDFFDFKLKRLMETIGNQNISQQRQIVNEMLDSLAAHVDPIKRNFYVNNISQKFNLQESTLLQELEKKRKNYIRRNANRDQKPFDSNNDIQDTISLTGAWRAEKDLLIIMFNHFKDVKEVIFELVEDEDFLNEGFRHIFELIKKNQSRLSKNLIHMMIAESKDDKIKNMITADLLKDIEQPDRYLNDCILRMKISRHQNQIDEIRQQLHRYQPSDPEFKQLLEKLNESMIQIQELRKIFSDR